MVTNADGLGRSEAWKTSDTFLGDIYSGDPERLSAAFKRFVECRLPLILQQIRNALPSHKQGDAEDVAQNVLIELHKDILSKGWRHPPETRFAQCVGQLARDAILVARRKMSRKREVELSEGLLEPACSELVSGFWRTEVLNAAECRVQAMTPDPQWTVYVWWKNREGMTADFVVNDTAGSSPMSANERQIVSRIRKAIRTEIEEIAERGGFEPQELLLERP
ncbi:MAG: hypothetical protein WCH39_23870 [Schlesneria sp.]